jgi:hypothetical protein
VRRSALENDPPFPQHLQRQLDFYWSVYLQLASIIVVGDHIFGCIDLVYIAAA